MRIRISVGRGEGEYRSRRWKMLWVLLAVLFFIFLGSSLLLQSYMDYLWFSSLGYLSLWLKPILVRFGLFFLMFSLTLLFFRFQIFLLDKEPEEETEVYFPGERFRPHRLLAGGFRKVYWPLAGVVAFVVALAFSSRWLEFLFFLNPVSFQNRDPIFGKDIGFYVFQLPFLRSVYNILWFPLIVAFLASAVYYALSGVLRFLTRFFTFTSPHGWFYLYRFLGVFFLWKAFGYQLAVWGLLYSPSGIFYGAGWTDVHARLPVFRLLQVGAVLVAILFFLAPYRKKLLLPFYGWGGWLAFSFVGGVLYPALLQALLVTPDELNKEEPFLKNHIQATRQAYGLDRVQSSFYPVKIGSLPEIQLEEESTVKNIRLWDYRPLMDTYRQLQEIRTYYRFLDVDIDRYRVEGEWRQVMLSARELDSRLLPQKAQTWVNQHLVFTHGYGAVVSPVERILAEGLPDFFVQDIPPKSRYPVFDIQRPEIYFGELTLPYILTATREEEFDYPRGDENVYTAYQGKDGLVIGSPFRRFLFALYFDDARLFFSSAVKSNSRIHFRRQILQRVRTLFPYFTYDPDPYLVIANGRLYWILDAYTSTSLYPYAQPAPALKWNYIRNPVKVVVDAYDGSVFFYAVQPEPVFQAYQKIFPGVFRDWSEMPQALKGHIRYPVQLFNIQSELLATYHMEDVSVFYNKEDLWTRAREIFANSPRAVEAYYVMVRPPGLESPEFLLMLPFTPLNRDNLIGWLYASNDPAHYGRLALFKFSKEALIYGPMQVEARIDQDPVISRELTLWSQRGSSVIRGNLLVLPIDGSLLYAEPLYIQAEEGKIPELKRVLLSDGQKVVMGANLREAISLLTGREAMAEEKAPVMAEKPAEAWRVFQELEEAFKRGDFATFGKKLEELKALLKP